MQTQLENKSSKAESTDMAFRYPHTRDWILNSFIKRLRDFFIFIAIFSDMIEYVLFKIKDKLNTLSFIQKKWL